MMIAEDALIELCEPADVQRPKKALLKRTVNRTRAALRPQEPKTLDFEIDRSFVDADDFLVADIKMDDGHRHFVFATDYQLSLLRDAKCWYVDGTLKFVGEPFRRQGQLFSIHAFVEKDGKRKQVPLVFCIMSRRKTIDYVQIFQAVIDEVERTVVEGFVVDFEAAAWQSIRTVFPGREIKGCVFHWGQAVWRHVQSLGLSGVFHWGQAVWRHVQSLGLSGVFHWGQAVWRHVQSLGLSGVFHWGQAVWRHVQSLGLSETYKKRRGLYTFVRM